MTTEKKKFADWNKEIGAAFKNSGKNLEFIDEYSALLINIWKYDQINEPNDAASRNTYLKEMTEDLTALEKKLTPNAKNPKELAELFANFKKFMQKQSKITGVQLSKNNKNSLNSPSLS